MKKLSTNAVLILTIIALLGITLLTFHKISKPRKSLDMSSLIQSIYLPPVATATVPTVSKSWKNNPTASPTKTSDPEPSKSSTPKASPENKDIKSPEPAPDFELPDSTGKNMVKLSDYKGKIVFLNFFTSWSALCKEQSIEIENAYQEVKNQNNSVFLGINLGENLQTIDNFIIGNKISYKILSDIDKKVGNLYNIKTVPSTCIIGKDGKLYLTNAGPLTKKDILDGIELFNEEQK